IERYPDMVEAHRELGRVYATDAMAKERGLEEGTPSSADLAAIIKRTWNYAEQAYQEVVALSDGDYKDWYNLGVAIQKQNQDEKRTSAIKAYERSITLNPDYPNAHYHLGILYESSNVSKAQEHYEIALRQARQMPKEEGQDLVMRCLASLGELNWRIGNKEKAAEYLTEYIQFAPGDAYIEQMLNQITSEPIGASE
ncbi:MAG: tetratricopeptide repeat protein, partial [Candidatus Omnitrophica bacterium]|nr:tetratricopeptide repeat protein [Candidatus Omnitrophota bacterium]